MDTLLLSPRLALHYDMGRDFGQRPGAARCDAAWLRDGKATCLEEPSICLFPLHEQV